MYIEEFILVDLDTLLHIRSMILEWEYCMENTLAFYTIVTKEEECENCSWMTIDSEGIIELQWHEKVSHLRTNE